MPEDQASRFLLGYHDYGELTKTPDATDGRYGLG